MMLVDFVMGQCGRISQIFIWVDTVAYRMSRLNTTLAVQIYTLDIDTHGGMFTIFKYQILLCAQE